jgi:antitoxin (DNA-binding transcriptional repressor) of toxin-antitoxin stability system
MKASIVDLRYKTKEILRAIDRNETVHLLYRGKEKALIIPLPKNTKSLAQTDIKSHAAFGMWKDHVALEEVNNHVRKLRISRYHDL